MSKPAPPKTRDKLPHKQKKDQEELPEKPTETVFTGSRRSRYPPKPVEAMPTEEPPWAPACEWKDILYSKRTADRELVLLGERIGWNGNRMWVVYNPWGNQETHLYRPPGWW
jgi:hypothetical protein